MVNQFLLNYINKQLDQGKSEEDIKKWLISAGLKPSDFDMEFEFIAHLGKLRSSDKHKVAPGHDYLEKISGREENKIPASDFAQKERTRWQKITPFALRIVLSLVAVLLVIMGLRYFSKNLANALDRTFSAAESTFGRIFSSEKYAVTSPWNVTSSTTDITVSSTSTDLASPLTIISEATSIVSSPENATTQIATSAAETSVGGTTTVATSVAAIPPVATSTDNAAFIYAANQSRILWNTGKYNESLAQAKSAFEKAQNDREKAIAQYWIGLSYYSLGDKSESEKAALSAIALNSSYEPPYVTVSAIKLDQNDCDQAFIYADKALRLNPKDPWALNNSGLAYYCLGDKENAILQLKKAVTLVPNSDIIWHNLNLYMAQI